MLYYDCECGARDQAVEEELHLRKDGATNWTRCRACDELCRYWYRRECGAPAEEWGDWLVRPAAPLASVEADLD